MATQKNTKKETYQYIMEHLSASEEFTTAADWARLNIYKGTLGKTLGDYFEGEVFKNAPGEHQGEISKRAAKAERNLNRRIENKTVRDMRNKLKASVKTGAKNVVKQFDAMGKKLENVQFTTANEAIGDLTAIINGELTMLELKTTTSKNRTIRWGNVSAKYLVNGDAFSNYIIQHKFNYGPNRKDEKDWVKDIGTQAWIDFLTQDSNAPAPTDMLQRIKLKTPELDGVPKYVAAAYLTTGKKTVTTVQTTDELFGKIAEELVLGSDGSQGKYGSTNRGGTLFATILGKHNKQLITMTSAAYKNKVAKGQQTKASDIDFAITTYINRDFFFE